MDSVGTMHACGTYNIYVHTYAGKCSEILNIYQKKKKEKEKKEENAYLDPDPILNPLPMRLPTSGVSPSLCGHLSGSSCSNQTSNFPECYSALLSLVKCTLTWSVLFVYAIIKRAYKAESIRAKKYPMTTHASLTEGAGPQLDHNKEDGKTQWLPWCWSSNSANLQVSLTHLSLHIH